MIKYCRLCATWLDRDRFSRRQGTKDSRQAYCKPCMEGYRQQRRLRAFAQGSYVRRVA